MEKVTKAVIPAAGFGTRFFPITKAMPKEMVPVVDKPVIQYVVEEAVASGCDDILIITGRNKRAIEDHFDVSAELNMHLQNSGNTELLEASERLSDLADIHYIRQKEQRGLGDAVLCAKQHIGDEPFAVLLGDTICLPDTGEKPCTAQLADVYCKTALPVIGVEEVPEHKIKDYGIIDGVLLEERLYDIIDIIEKPSPEEAPSNLINVSKYVMTPELLKKIVKYVDEHDFGPKDQEYMVTDPIDEFIKNGGIMRVAPTNGEYLDGGSVEGWLHANNVVVGN
jgi:UTP--glucose-1-phosphate uridylyltransferase